MWQTLLAHLQQGDVKALARAISLVENSAEGYELLLQNLPSSSSKIIGITGPPGAGKSTLTDALIEQMVNDGKRVAVLCVDPSSPFNFGAVLGDRIRMSNWYVHPQVYIRSLATRGSMGGLHPKIIEITDVVKAAHFDYIILETVGVGQSEVEIAGIADVTMVVIVPEAGDEIQTMKAGLMEIADVFVVNKSDRPGADAFVKNLQLMLAPVFSRSTTAIPIIKTTATEKSGVVELYKAMNEGLKAATTSEKKYWLLTEKVYQLLQQERMKGIDKQKLREQIKQQALAGGFNTYQFLQTYSTGKATK